MGRKRMCRRLSGLPGVKGFRPLEPAPFKKDPVILSLDQYEALRLCDYENLSQEEAALRMEISRPTFTRLYDEARKKLIQALVEGRVFLMEGGNVKFDCHFFQCRECGQVFESEEKSASPCPHCGSGQIFSRTDFFMRGCGCPRREDEKETD